MARLAPLPPPPAAPYGGGGGGVFSSSSSTSAAAAAIISKRRASFRMRGHRANRGSSGRGATARKDAVTTSDAAAPASAQQQQEADAATNSAVDPVASADDDDSIPPPPPLPDAPAADGSHENGRRDDSNDDDGNDGSGSGSDSDDEWRTPGRLRRARLLRRDREGGGASFASTFNGRAPILKYYELADRILSQFRTVSDVAAVSAAPPAGSLDEPYLMGHRLAAFLSDVLPTHPAYPSNDPSLLLRRRKMSSDLREVRERLEALALRIDESERNGYILRDLEGVPNDEPHHLAAADCGGGGGSIEGGSGLLRPPRHSRHSSLEILDDLVEAERSRPSSRNGSICSRNSGGSRRGESVCSNSSSSSSTARRRRVKFSDSVSVEGENEAVPMINNEVIVTMITGSAASPVVSPVAPQDTNNVPSVGGYTFTLTTDDDIEKSAFATNSASSPIKRTRSDGTESTVNTSSSTIDTLASDCGDGAATTAAAVDNTRRQPRHDGGKQCKPLPPPPATAPRRSSSGPSASGGSLDPFDARSFESGGGGTGTGAGPVGWDVSFQEEQQHGGAPRSNSGGNSAATASAAAAEPANTAGEGGGAAGGRWESFNGWGPSFFAPAPASPAPAQHEQIAPAQTPGAANRNIVDKDEGNNNESNADSESSHPDIVEAPTDERTEYGLSSSASNDATGAVSEDVAPLDSSPDDDEEEDYEAFLAQTQMEFVQDDDDDIVSRPSDEDDGGIASSPSDEATAMLRARNAGDGNEEAEGNDDDDDRLDGDAIEFPPADLDNEAPNDEDELLDHDDKNADVSFSTSSTSRSDDCLDDLSSEGSVFSGDFDSDDDDDECRLSNLSFVERVQMENLVRGPREFEEDDSDAVDSWAPSVAKNQEEEEKEEDKSPRAAADDAGGSGSSADQDQDQVQAHCGRSTIKQRTQPQEEPVAPHLDDVSVERDHEDDLDLFAADSPHTWPSLVDDDDDLHLDGSSDDFDDDLEAEHEEFARLAQLEFQAECGVIGGPSSASSSSSALRGLGLTLPDPEGLSFCAPPAPEEEEAPEISPKLGIRRVLVDDCGPGVFDPFGNNRHHHGSSGSSNTNKDQHHGGGSISCGGLSAGASTVRTDPTLGSGSGNGDSSLSEQSSDPEEDDDGGRHYVLNLPHKLDHLECMLEALHHRRVAGHHEPDEVEV